MQGFKGPVNISRGLTVGQNQRRSRVLTSSGNNHVCINLSICGKLNFIGILNSD
jgi:hypothetical protein